MLFLPGGLESASQWFRTKQKAAEPQAGLRSSSWSAPRFRFHMSLPWSWEAASVSLLAARLFLFRFQFWTYCCVCLCLASHSKNVSLVRKMSSRFGDVVTPKDWMSKARSITDNKSHVYWVKGCVKRTLVALWCFTCVITVALSRYTRSETPINY